MASEQTLSLKQTLASLPAAIEQTDLAAEIRRRQATGSLPLLVVLDDDPTGTQTCHGINVLTVWNESELLEEFQSGAHGFFILTNTRALPASEARELVKEICRAVNEAGLKADKSFNLVLRSDSTLRGHFLDEFEAAEEMIGKANDWIVAPFFRQGGRVTINDVHYVADAEGNLVPAAQTQFAKDATFGYTNSNLINYVVEKSKGTIQAEQVKTITLQDIRMGGPTTVTQRLLGFEGKSVVVVNAVVDTDMEVFIQGLLQAELQGKSYIYRTGAAFVSTRLGIQQIAPKSAQDLKMDLSMSAPGGLIIAGSYVPKTTAQLESLVKGRGDKLTTITIDVEPLLASPESAEKNVLKAVDKAGELILAGRDVLLMTSRKLITGVDELSSLKIGSVVANALVQFLRMLVPRPRYIIAKGGITSSDAATKGLRMRRARIVGQAAAGVPLWQCHERTSKYTGIPYVVFPGNVGENNTLRDLVVSWELPDKPSQTPMQYQRLGKSGLKVSKIILGCMAFGNSSWEGSPWVMSESQALPLLKKAYDIGINTWDTANTYSNGVSESIIGKALEEYSIPRSKVVIMTKLYYPVLEGSNCHPYPAINTGALVNQMGLSRKHIFEAVEGSLRRLNTTYIDVLQLHRLDTDTEPEEVMRALHDLVTMGKIHYIGASSMYCWQLARLQYTAKMNGWTSITSMQGFYNLLYREEERETNPFCKAEGIGLVPWSPLARGLLARPWSHKTARGEVDKKTTQWLEGEYNNLIVERVEKLAKNKGCTMASIATAWLLTKGCAPIVGLNSLERIREISQALDVNLSDMEVNWLEELYRPLAVQAI